MLILISMVLLIGLACVVAYEIISDIDKNSSCLKVRTGDCFASTCSANLNIVTGTDYQERPVHRSQTVAYFYPTVKQGYTEEEARRLRYARQQQVLQNRARRQAEAEERARQQYYQAKQTHRPAPPQYSQGYVPQSRAYRPQTQAYRPPQQAYRVQPQYYRPQPQYYQPPNRQVQYRQQPPPAYSVQYVYQPPTRQQMSRQPVRQYATQQAQQGYYRPQPVPQAAQVPLI